MERSCLRLRFFKASLTMSRFNPGYRRKSGNNNKPFRRYRDDNLSEVGDFSVQNVSDCRKRNSRLDNAVINDQRWRKKPELLAKEGFRTFTTLPVESRSGEHSAGGSTHQKRPPGLKGKEIGLWYRDQNRLKAQNGLKREKKKYENVIEVKLDPSSQAFITNVLNQATSSFAGSPEELEDSNVNEEYATFEEKVNEAKLNTNLSSERLNMQLYSNMLKKADSKHYRSLCSYREKLPVFEMKSKILDTIRDNQVVVISGGTGCGKTTQIVQYVLDEYILKKKGSLCNIMCTQPRRIAAITVAERVASERNEELRDCVGYQIRLENMQTIRNKGCINFVTTGVLLAKLESDPILSTVTHLFLDEIHERDVDSDLMLAIIKYIIPKRPDLKLILMSATVNSSSFVKYFENVPCIEIPGLTYPVEEIFLESVLEKTKFQFEKGKSSNTNSSFNDYVLPYVRQLEVSGLYSKFVLKQLRNPLSEELNIRLAAEMVRYICMKEADGAILVFLPGLSDIINLNREIMESNWYLADRHILIPIHSIIPTIHQKQAFETPPKGVRKIVLATSILETSITIDDIVYVVDTGKHKSSGYDIKAKVATLEPSWITLANAKQRRGRAGRTQPGKCFKLYTKVRQELLEKFPTPDIKTMSLEGVILKAKLLNLGKVKPFLEKLLDPPDSEMVELSLKVLKNLNALDSEELLTPLGYHLSKLPIDPQAGKMILMAALFSCIDPVLSVAACLSFKDPFFVPLGREDEVYEVKDMFAAGERSDHFVYIEAVRRWEETYAYGGEFDFARKSFLSNQTMGLLRGMKLQFAHLLHSMNFLVSSNPADDRSNINSNNKGLVTAIICAGLYPNVAHLEKWAGGKIRVALLKTVDHGRVLFHKKSYCSKMEYFDSPFFVYHQMLKSTSIFIHDATMVYPMPLLFFGERLDLVKHGTEYYVHVDDMVIFKTNKDTITLVKKLKSHLDSILKSEISNPKPFDWDTLDEKTEILSAIVKLVSSDAGKSS